MKTLEGWQSRLAAVPRKIECPEMQLLSAHDFEPPVFVGPGYIDIKSTTQIEFTMFASTADHSDAYRRLTRAIDNPYDIIDQFRLNATDYRGTRWACGWTGVQLKELPSVGWPLTGQLHAISTDVSDSTVCPDSGVELLFQPQPRLPMGTWMTSTTTVDDEEVLHVRRPARHVVSAMGTEIVFSSVVVDDSLWVGARTSSQLPHPYAENWLSEPLRILLGQHIFPRLVARNFGDGRAIVSLRVTPDRDDTSSFAALAGTSYLKDRSGFWTLYASLLKLIATATDDNGQNNFESHPITRYYEEIVQANCGSRWVLCMTCASVAEGLAKMLMGDRRVDFDTTGIDQLTTFLKSWPGDTRLRKRILELVRSPGERSVGQYFRDLVKKGVLEQRHEQSWSSVRHAVMHGNLVSPWASEKDDARLRNLGDLVHRLTRQLASDVSLI
jgi:hypothetical protein